MSRRCCNFFVVVAFSVWKVIFQATSCIPAPGCFYKSCPTVLSFFTFKLKLVVKFRDVWNWERNIVSDVRQIIMCNVRADSCSDKTPSLFLTGFGFTAHLWFWFTPTVLIRPDKRTSLTGEAKLNYSWLRKSANSSRLFPTPLLGHQLHAQVIQQTASHISVSPGTNRSHSRGHLQMISLFPRGEKHLTSGIWRIPS